MVASGLSAIRRGGRLRPRGRRDMTKRHLAFLTKFAISGLILAIVFHNTDMERMAGRLDSVRALPLSAAVGCLFIQAIAVGTWRWHVVLRTIHRNAGLLALGRMIFVGVFFNQVLPTTFGGDGVRAWLLSRTDMPIDVAVRSVVLDRALGLFGLFLLGFIASLAAILLFDRTANIVWAFLFSALGVLLIVISPYLFSYLQKIRLPRMQRLFSEFTKEIGFLFNSKRNLGALILISLLGHVLNCLAVWYAARAFAIEIPLGPTLVIVPMVLLVAALPISIAGWGVREGGMVFGLGLIGVSGSDAALVSVAVGLMGVALGLLGGLVWIVTRPRVGPSVDRPLP